MNAAIKLLDKYAEVCKHASDSETARALKVQPSAVNNWRHDRAKPDAESIERMCDAINEPLAHWLPLIEAERARTPGSRKAWLRLAGIAASLVAVYTAIRFGSDFHGAAAFVLSPVYIMRNIRCLIASPPVDARQPDFAATGALRSNLNHVFKACPRRKHNPTRFPSLLLELKGPCLDFPTLLRCAEAAAALIDDQCTRQFRRVIVLRRKLLS